MPTYEYRCETNGRTIEVQHPMSKRLRTWGEACELSGEAIGTTPAEAPIEKALSLSFVSSTKPASSSMPTGGCGPGCGCSMH